MRFSDSAIEKVINTWITITDSIEDDNNRAGVKQFMEDFQERLFSDPASPSVDYAAAHNCMPCGLAEHLLRVLRMFKKLCDTHAGEFDHDIHNDDIIIAALFHDMGKIGDHKNAYYAPQDSDWHADRGMFYKINPDIDYMRVQHRSLFLLQHYGIKLPIHAFKAVLLHDGQHEPINSPYSMKEGLFAILLSHADLYAAFEEQRRYLDWEKTS